VKKRRSIPRIEVDAEGLKELRLNGKNVIFCHTIKAANVQYMVSITKTSNHIVIACFLHRHGIAQQYDTRGIRTEQSLT
jgi:hypothetical protein